MDRSSLQAFREELTKIADYELTDSMEKVERRLKPGDILATKVRDPGFVDKLIRVGLETFGGTPYTHVGMYAGDGKVIDAGYWKSHKKGDKSGWSVVKVPLKDYDERYKFRVLRVSDATTKERQDAVDYANKQVGRKYSLSKLLRLALPVPEDEMARRKQTRQDAVQSMICSQLIANAYHKRPFGSSRLLQHVRPVDIQKSSLTHIVIEKR